MSVFNHLIHSKPRSMSLAPRGEEGISGTGNGRVKARVGGVRGVGGKDENREEFSARVHTQRSPFPG